VFKVRRPKQAVEALETIYAERVAMGLWIKVVPFPLRFGHETDPKKKSIFTAGRNIFMAPLKPPFNRGKKRRPEAGNFRQNFIAPDRESFD